MIFTLSHPEARVQATQHHRSPCSMAPGVRCGTGGTSLALPALIYIGNHVVDRSAVGFYVYQVGLGGGLRQ
jgi:hypothetical protein